MNNQNKHNTKKKTSKETEKNKYVLRYKDKNDNTFKSQTIQTLGN
jgi:hypothetical protein